MRAVFLLVGLTLAPWTAGAPDRQQSRPSLVGFRSEKELSGYMGRLWRERERLDPSVCRQGSSSARKVAAPRELTLELSGRQGAVIRATVTTTTGTAVEGAQLTVEAIGLRAITGKDGRLQLRIPADSLRSARTVTVTARSIGYDTRRQQLEVKRGEAHEVRFRLCPSPYRLEEAVVASAGFEDESVTNTQDAGVDEGGIIKLHGNHLVILRRGWLSTVSIAAGGLRTVASVDAYAHGIEPGGDWYDELLLYRDKVIVIGYSYRRGGTEIGTFRIDPSGRIRHLATHHLRSNDYYSSRNYASRLVGGTLVFYTPLYADPRLENPLASLPSMRKWDPEPGTGGGGFRRIVSWQRVFRPAGSLNPLDFALHTVTSCDLDRQELECEATVVVGPPGRVFYVSPNAVYVWSTPWRRPDPWREDPSALYRLPLDGGRPAMVEASGSPVDQFSFLEDDQGFLNVVVQPDGRGEAMWSAEGGAGRVALLRLPLDRFDRIGRVPAGRYRPLPGPKAGAFHNRFVGRHLLYGGGNGWSGQSVQQAELFVAPLDGEEVQRFAMRHGIDRIEPMGRHAVVIGSGGDDLHFRTIRLDGRPALSHGWTREKASQGELRSHGFFYRDDGNDRGVIGLPIRGAGRPGYEHLLHGSASLLFLRNDGERFGPLGELRAWDEKVVDDGCKASCVDWYGNARPLFIRGRVFALLGYELVEGTVGGEGIREVRRVSFAPPAR
jgi:hypothetical protein